MSKSNKDKIARMLDYKIKHHHDVKGKTVRKVFELLLVTLFDEEDCFSGKRPLGNSNFYCFLEEVVHSEFPDIILRVNYVDDDTKEIYDITYEINEGKLKAYRSVVNELVIAFSREGTSQDIKDLKLLASNKEFEIERLTKIIRKCAETNTDLLP